MGRKYRPDQEISIKVRSILMKNIETEVRVRGPTVERMESTKKETYFMGYFV